MNVLTADDIDFSLYEQETDAQQKVLPASIYLQDFVERLKAPHPKPMPALPWRKTHGKVAFRPGEVTLWAGANGSGKSLITGQVCMSLLAQNQKVCIASFEMKPQKTIERMARQYTGFDGDFLRNNHPQELPAFFALLDDMKACTSDLWLYDQQGTVKADRLFAVIRYCAQELGVQHFVVDSLMKCVAGDDDYNGQKELTDKLTALARDHNIHIHLVHHVRKPDDDSKRPTKWDSKGSSAVTDLVDNVMMVWRNKPKERLIDAGKATDKQMAEPDALLVCDKQRNGDWEGAIGLFFDKTSHQYLAEYGASPIGYRSAKGFD